MACKRTSMAPDVVAGTIDAYHDGLVEKANRLDKATGGAGNAKIPVIWKFGTLGTIVPVSGAALSNDTQGVEKLLMLHKQRQLVLYHIMLAILGLLRV